MAAEVHIQEEQYIFKPETKKILIYLLVTGIIIFAIGLFLAMNAGGHDEHGGGHASVEMQKMTASINQEAAAEGHGHAEAAGGGEHHGSPAWLKRLYSTLWMNNVFFTGLGIIGLFFVAIQYAAQAGWSAGVKRIPLAMGSWIPVAGLLMLGLFFVVKGDVFHWTHAGLYEKGGADFDSIINGKGAFFFWPLGNGTFPIFFILRMVIALHCPATGRMRRSTFRASPPATRKFVDLRPRRRGYVPREQEPIELT